MQINNKLTNFKNNQEIIHYLDVLKNKYKINKSQFIRTAIVEKIKKDIPEIRKQYLVKIGKQCPF
jgi:hypothetical protein